MGDMKKKNEMPDAFITQTTDIVDERALFERIAEIIEICTE
jgi:hypothetical protein